MTLKPCKECNKDISEWASVCPNCGISHPGQKTGKLFLLRRIAHHDFAKSLSTASTPWPLVIIDGKKSFNWMPGIIEIELFQGMHEVEIQGRHSVREEHLGKFSIEIKEGEEHRYEWKELASENQGDSHLFMI
jgi:hypothetical protein